MTRNLCRLCLCKAGKTAVTIFADGVAFERLRSRILDCCPVELFESEVLPRVICGTCETRVNAAYEFREQCRRSERTLRERYVGVYRRTSGSGSSLERLWETESRAANPCSTDVPPTDAGREGEDVEVEAKGGIEERGSVVTARSAALGPDKKVPLDCSVESKSRKVLESAKAPNVAQRERRRRPAEETQSYLCDICSKTFASKSGLRFHLKGHNGAKPHVCRYCDKGFAIPSYRKRHERVHAGDKRYVCHVCSASFASSNGFKYHLSLHTGEANHRCDTCGKSFRRYKYLKEHVFTHTGERPFACKICGTAYGNSGSLFAHERKCKLRS